MPTICIATIVEACNTWEWYAPYATNIIIQGIFGNQTFEEAYKELGFQWVIENYKRIQKDKNAASNSIREE